MICGKSFHCKGQVPVGLQHPSPFPNPLSNSGQTSRRGGELFPQLTPLLILSHLSLTTQDGDCPLDPPPRPPTSIDVHITLQLLTDLFINTGTRILINLFLGSIQPVHNNAFNSHIPSTILIYITLSTAKHWVNHAIVKNRKNNSIQNC